MPLCGSSRCGCALVSVPAATGAINGALPTIDVAGNGTPASPWNLTLNDEWAAEVAALGVKGYVQRTTSQGSITTVVDITSLTLTWTAAADRRYRISGYVGIYSVGGPVTDGLSVSIANGAGTQMIDDQVFAPNVGSVVFSKPSYILSGASGSVTYKLRARRTGSGTASTYGVADNPSWMMVEDIGPA